MSWSLFYCCVETIRQGKSYRKKSYNWGLACSLRGLAHYQLGKMIPDTQFKITHWSIIRERERKRRGRGRRRRRRREKRRRRRRRKKRRRSSNSGGGGGGRGKGKREKQGKIGLTWHLETSKPTSSDTLSQKAPPTQTKSCLGIFLKQCYSLKHSNIWAYKGHSYSNHSVPLLSPHKLIVIL